jgi:RNA polymerase sigma-70 factor (ECF subfamily)
VLFRSYSRIWARAHRFDPARGAAATWLAAVMRNLCIDRLRARPMERADDTVLERLADTGRGPEAELIARDEARRVLDCLGTLEPDRAQAVRGAYLDGLSYEALSARFGVPLNTMRSWLRRGLMRLRECLEP